MTDKNDNPLHEPVSVLYGVGEERAKQLSRIGVSTIEDLLLLKPRRYEDRRNFAPISSLKTGDSCLIRGKIIVKGIKTFRRRSRSLFEMIIEDNTGRLYCRFWNQPYRDRMYNVGDELLVFGKVVSERPKTMDNPEIEVLCEDEDSSLHVKRIVPVYPLTEGLSQRWLRSLVWRTLNKYIDYVREPYDNAAELAEKLANLKLLPRRTAIYQMHFPDDMDKAELAIQRLAFDEFLQLQMNLRMRRISLLKNARGLNCGGNNSLIKPFLSNLGFKLTDAQIRVLREIRHDLSSGIPMRRLLQGDVGSGKTVVAACAALMTIESGYNVVLMAPTEILAGQHYKNFLRWFEPLGIKVFILTGSIKNYTEFEENLFSKSVAGTEKYGHIVIGTHALLEADFNAEKLGLVIIDEQHKFGVAQREAIVKKGIYPHLLIMTATPIPRTLGLTIYGDLDVSILDSMPPGRAKIKTFIRGVDKLNKVYDFVKQKLSEGRQAYIVYPRLEEGDEEADIRAVQQEFEKLKNIFAPYRVGLAHGRMPQQEREFVMSEFARNSINVLVSTTVIEVGIDIPNATVMVIMNAEMYGLSQLHQLRGRIGRGEHESYCILIANLKTPKAVQRLKILEETTDGFRISEADLLIRGPGELLGKAQSGMPDFKFGDLTRDLRLMEAAKTVAARICANNH
jgi:ATP-dependent DNA helicase RecG